MEPELQQPQEQPKQSSKLVIILLILILAGGAYLAYAMYMNSTSTESTDQTVTSPDPTQEVPNNSASSEMTTLTDGPMSYTTAEVAQNNTPESCWTIISGNVYNITSYVPNHPGGVDEISQICGKDGTQLFSKPEQHVSGGAKDVLVQFKIGTLAQ